MSYDPQSADAMFSRIIQRLDSQDVLLTRIDAGVAKTNGRVSALEKWRDVVTAKTALIASVVSGGVGVLVWVIGLFFKS
jgi:hypothetical protein